MSKSRTGRKGRVRLALAAALQDVEAGDTGNDVVTSANRLGADSGFRSGDSDKTNAQILDYVQGQLHKPGSANALFTQGEVRGPLLNSVDTQNGASGAITSADSGTYSAATGETDVAALAPLSTGDGTFAHYVLPDASVHANAAAGVASGTTVTSTDLRGIAYHSGGPGSDFVPIQHLGAGVASPVAAQAIAIAPTVATVWGDSGVSNPTSLRVEVCGTLINTNGGDDTEGGDEIQILSTNNTAASAVIKFRTAGTGAAALNSFADGHEIKVRDASGDVVLTVVGHLAANAGSTLAPSNASPSQGQNFDATTDASSNIVYVVPHASEGGNGNLAYDGSNTDTNAASGIGQFVATLVAGINALSDAQGLGITASQGTSNDADELTLTYDRLRGTSGNATGGAAAEAALTVTGYSSSGQILVPALTAHSYLGDGANSLGGGTDAAAARVLFANGTSGTDYDTVSATIANDGSGSAIVKTQTDIGIQDLPVKVVYLNDDAARQGLSSGIPADSSAGFVVVWGPV